MMGPTKAVNALRLRKKQEKMTPGQEENTREKLTDVLEEEGKKGLLHFTII